MKTSVKKFTAFILAITLTLPFMVFATAQDEKATSDGPDIAYEMPEMRNEYEKHFLMSDGTAVAAMYAAPVNYYDISDNTWKEIDNTLTLKNGRYQNKGHGGFDVSFRGENDTGDFVKITVDEHTLSWNVSVQNALGTKDTLKRQVSATVSRNQDTQNNKFAAKNAGASIKYNSPFSGNKIIDVNYTVSQYKVKEDITIYSPKDGNAIYYTYNCGELTAVLNKDNSIDFIDEAGNPIYTVHSPYMYDSAGNGSHSFRITLKQTDDICTVVMTPDKEWLDTAVYPVVIDPTVTNRKLLEYYEDTYIHSGDSAGDHVSEETMTIGKINGVQNYALIKISTFPTVPTGSTVLGIDLVLRLPEGSETGGPFTLKQTTTAWNESTVCYNNRPIANTVIASSVPANFDALTITFDITSFYNALLAGTTLNYGFQIENTDTTLNDFNCPYTSNCGDFSQFPVVQIRYTPINESESNNTFATADEIELLPQPGIKTYISGTKASGTSADYDYFKFIAPRHGRVEVFLTVYGTTAYTLSVYNENQSLNNSTTTALLTHYPDGTKTMTGGLSFTATKDGDSNGSLDTYYIRVYAPASATCSYRLMIEYSTDYASLNWQYPLDTTTGYLYNRHATSHVGARGSGYHKGMDITATPTTVFAPTNAKVLYAGWDNDLGNYVTLYTKGVSNGDTDPFAGEYYFVITFMHLTSYQVSAGNTVAAGDILGVSGNTGDSKGAHLHIEIYLSNAASPDPYSDLSRKDLIINPYDFYYSTVNFTGTPY